ncbi:hypothetical protein HHK36_017841 [Tetracentron sinense]|uniref:Protein FAR1-RELATED SEQUENCE n=1 Tax=Tetracentron sinense TaxID=13715 RepID=A0A835DCY8_TETSI|nr:hypothetical protein HHK36_017841 [Tetracentron sinense]
MEMLIEEGVERNDRLDGECTTNFYPGDHELEEDYSIVEPFTTEGDSNRAPNVGMEFETKESAYEAYNLYAETIGFATKLKSSHARKSTSELYHVLYTCNKEGFSRRIEKTPDLPRPDLRSDCKARMRLKLTDSKKWKVVETIIEHNHPLNPSERFPISNKHLDGGSKRSSQSNYEARKMLTKSYPTLVVDSGGHENLPFWVKECYTCIDPSRWLKLGEGDSEAIHQFFSRMQFKNPAFFYVIDLDEEGCLRNVFWADARSRAACAYFGDIIMLDTTCLTNKYDMPLVYFLGVNHHGQSVLLGCGLLADETRESFIWLFKAWLKSVSGHLPNAIITDQCGSIQGATTEVFPEACHRLCLWHIMNKLPDKLGGLSDYKAVKKVLKNAVYDSKRVGDFEMAWENMINGYGLADNEWLRMVYENRQKWVPVFVKDTFYAGMSTSQRNETLNVFFDGFVYPKTSLKDFLDKYELVLQSNYKKEIQADFESFHTVPVLKFNCCFEGQLAKIYTKGIFNKFQAEVSGMSLCFNILQVKVDGPIITYMVKERSFAKDGSSLGPKTYEVHFNKTEVEVHCICRLFQFKGFLCRHALYVLNENDVDEVPCRYILSRWRKDFKHTCLDYCSSDVGIGNEVHRHNDLYIRIIQIVEEAAISEHTYEVALQALQETLFNLRNRNDLVVTDMQSGATPCSSSRNTRKRSESHVDKVCTQRNVACSSNNSNACESSGMNELLVIPQTSITRCTRASDPLQVTKRVCPTGQISESSSERNIAITEEINVAKAKGEMCSICKEPGHTISTCQKEQFDPTELRIGNQFCTQHIIQQRGQFDSTTELRVGNQSGTQQNFQQRV